MESPLCILCRSKYEDVITSLNIRSLRIQAGQNVVVRATEDGLVVDKAGDSVQGSVLDKEEEVLKSK